MEITTLVENSSQDPALPAEFGLSLHIGINGRTLLFDMGASDQFARNARALDIDLSRVDAAVISHAHYDHGGGLAHFMAANQTAPVYLMAAADGDCYANIGARLPQWLLGTVYPLVRHSRRFSRYIGLDRSLFQPPGERFQWLTQDTEIQENISIVTRIGRRFPRAEGNKFLLAPTRDGLGPDPFDHELVLVVKAPDGLVVFTGCGHSGVINMVDAVRRAFPQQAVKAVVGGFHLSLQIGKPAIAGRREDIEAIGHELIRAGVEKVYTGHCTGDEAYDILRSVLGGRLGRLTTGARITL